MGLFCFGLLAVLLIIGFILQISSGESFSSPSRYDYNDDFDPFDPEKDPYANETLLAILEDEYDIIDWTGNGPGL